VHVAFDATAIGSGLGGDETLMATLLRALVHRPAPGARLSVLAAEGAVLPGELAGRPGVTVTRTVRRGGAAHFGMDLPRWLASRPDAPDVVVTNTHAPLWSPAPVALVVPDLSFVHRPDAYPAATRRRLHTLVPRQARRAAAVVTISEFSRRDLVATLDLDPGRVHAVPLTIEAPPPTAPVEGWARLAARDVRRPFLLYLGNLHPRKNVARAIRAFTAVRHDHPRLAHHRFVVAGGRWWTGGDEERAAAASGGSVLFLGRVDDDEREALLREAEALVYLSEFEGFGLPPLEAMTRGTPVLAAAATAIPEVCGDAALLVPPRDDRAVRDGLTAVLADPATRRRLVAAGFARSAAYTMDRTATALRASLDHAAAGAPARSGGAR
jgi:glycosyltransferase involved in cell wall biosynthesis